MPTYEYQCEKCGKTFEKFQPISAEPLKTCIDDSCGGTVHRLLSGGAGVIFKGSGFYQTDYRSDSYKKAAKADSSSDGGTTKKSTTESKKSASSSDSSPSS
jgi:putative FmdB family regulatory protein